MSNLFWYILLSIIGIGIIIPTIYIGRNTYRISTLIVFYFFAASITWIGEFIVLGLFNSYAYKTGLFTNIWAQNLFGHLLLNTTLYPAIAIVIVVYSLRYRGVFVATALFILIEYFYMKLGVYEQHWWRFYMTAAVVIIFLLISMYWFDKITHRPSRTIRNMTFYLSSMVIIHMPAPILLLLGKQYYRLGWVSNLFVDLYLSSIVIIFSYHLLESFLCVLFVCILKKTFWKVVPFVFSISVQTVLYKTNILVVHNGWKFIYTIFIYELFIAAFLLVEKYCLKPEVNKFVGNQ